MTNEFTDPNEANHEPQQPPWGNQAPQGPQQPAPWQNPTQDPNPQNPVTPQGSKSNLIVIVSIITAGVVILLLGFGIAGIVMVLPEVR